MRNLTKNVGGACAARGVKPEDKYTIKRILVSRPNNRLGNLLLITPLLQELETTFPGCTTDVFVRGGLAPKLFKNYTSVGRYIKLPGKPFKHLVEYTGAWFRIKARRYDLVINVIENSSSGRLSTKFSSSKFKLFGDVGDAVKAKYPDYRHTAKYPVYNLREFMGTANGQPVPLLDLRLSEEEKKAGRQILHNIVDANKKTIAIFTFATGTKCYACAWWETFYEKLKTEFPDHNIIEILPIENVSQINFAAPSFYGQDIRELGAVIAAADVFIGADSGIMHLSSAVHTPTAGLFYVTDPASFGPYGNGSKVIDTNHETIDSWIATVKGMLAVHK